MPRGSPKQRSAVPTPASRLGEWSEAEKEKLRELHTELGPEGEKAWNQLATQLPGRSGRAALKQWNKMIKRQAPRRHRTLGWEAVKMPAKGRHGLVRTKDGERFARQQNPRGKRSYAEVARRGSGQFISPTAQRRRGASSTQATPKPTPQCHKGARRRSKKKAPAKPASSGVDGRRKKEVGPRQQFARNSQAATNLRKTYNLSPGKPLRPADIEGLQKEKLLPPSYKPQTLDETLARRNAERVPQRRKAKGDRAAAIAKRDTGGGPAKELRAPRGSGGAATSRHVQDAEQRARDKAHNPTPTLFLAGCAHQKCIEAAPAGTAAGEHVCGYGARTESASLLQRVARRRRRTT
jgi:hypothetical protein